MGTLHAALICLVGLALLTVPAAAPAAPPDLAGVWEARRDFGPPARGPLTITYDGSGWRATIAGKTAPVDVRAGDVGFTLPGGAGSFRGRIVPDGRTLSGFWTQPPTVFIGNAFRTPVTATRTADGGWRGLVTPLDDHMTLYLVVGASKDGGYAVFLRNPERNGGRVFNPDRLEWQGEAVRLTKAGVGMARGQFDAGADTIQFVLPAFGGAFDFRRAGPDSGFYPRGGSPAPYVYRPPAPRDDGWPVASLEDVGVDRAPVEALVRRIIAMPDDGIHAPTIHGVLIARHGKLALEEYFHGFSADEPHDTRSAAKSLAAVLFGAAVQAGEPVTLATPVYATLAGGAPPSGLDPRKASITLRHLMTMSSGLDCNDWDDTTPGSEDSMQNQTRQPDWRRFTLELPMARAPGTLSLYCAGGANLVGAVLEKATGEPDAELFDRLVARPMGIRRYYMNLAPNGDVYLGGGMHFLPRDFMKFGQLMLDGGTWRGERILPADFAAAAVSPQTRITDRSHGARDYGYLFWINHYAWRGRQVDAFFMAGNGGQIVMGVPALDLVMAFYGGSYSDVGAFLAQDAFVPNAILPAVEPDR